MQVSLCGSLWGQDLKAPHCGQVSPTHVVWSPLLACSSWVLDLTQQSFSDSSPGKRLCGFVYGTKRSTVPSRKQDRGLGSYMVKGRLDGLFFSWRIVGRSSPFMVDMIHVAVLSLRQPGQTSWCHSTKRPSARQASALQGDFHHFFHLYFPFFNYKRINFFYMYV